MLRNALARSQGLDTRRRLDQHRTGGREQDPNDLDAVAEVPVRLLDQGLLRFILAGDLRREDRCNAAKAAGSGTESGARHRRRGLRRRADAGLVAGGDEARALTDPQRELRDEIGGGILLVVATRRHVEEPPLYVLDAPVDEGPRRRIGRLEALRCRQDERQLDRDARNRCPLQIRNRCRRYKVDLSTAPRRPKLVTLRAGAPQGQSLRTLEPTGAKNVTGRHELGRKT